MSEVIEIPIEKIRVEEGHNPRSDFDVKSIEALSKSIEQRGVLSPISVRQDGDEYFLIAGERRLRAAQGVLKTIPAIIANGRSGQADERLIDALIENIQREDLSVADEVSGYRKLKEAHGWDAKRIAHETGFAQNRVTKRMQLLVLPDDAIDAAASVPERARVQLVKLAGLDSGGAGEVARWLADQSEDTKSEFGKVPGRYLDGFKCTSGVPFLVERGYYDASTFQLSAERHAVREELDTHGYGVKITIGPRIVNAAKQLQAGTDLADCYVIGGWEVCCELAGQALEHTKAESEKRAEQYASSYDTGTAQSRVVVDPETGQKVEDDGRKKEIRSERNKQAQQEREAAIAFNEALAPHIVQKGASLKLTAANARLLSFFVLQAHGTEWCARGLRYIHPNGRVNPESEDGKSRVAKYVESGANAQLLRDWIGAARKAEEILSRTLTVIAAAKLADNTAVAQSNRIGFEPNTYMGVFDQPVVEDDLDKLIRQLLPKSLLDRIDERAAASSSAADDGAGDDGEHDDEGHVSDDADGEVPSDDLDPNGAEGTE
jgi:ParB/RepB/Spo0J family partition protein